ncbi:MAG: magnesium transporter [Candidatus Nanoarchaeia archaeon]|nr:magnesium transporter [Candidatus Nanoarchaeia archaeon]
MKLSVKIIKESLVALVIVSLISSIGGIGLQAVEENLLVLAPLIIIFPAMNNMLGGLGCIVSSKFTTLLYLGKIKPKNWKSSKDIKQMMARIIAVSVVSAVYLVVLAFLISAEFSLGVFIKVFLMILIITVVVTLSVSIIAVIGGLYIHKKNMDPDNFLIPISTATADMLSLLMFSVMIIVFF